MIKVFGESDNEVIEIVDPYWLYEMARGSGLNHEQAVKEVRQYCVSEGLDPYSI